MTIKSMSYEKCREDFFVNLIKHATNKIRYWKRQTGYRCELADNLSQAGAEIQYCQDALAALEKQIPKKLTMKAMSGFEYEVAAELVCPTCGNAVINYWNKRINPPHCMMCGQAIDWSESK